MRIKNLLVCGSLLCSSVMLTSIAYATECRVNVDRMQTFTTPQDKYVVRLQGYTPADVLGITINPFPPPNNVEVSVDTDGSTMITFSGSGLLPPSPPEYHFGYVLNNCPEDVHGYSTVPGTKDEYWDVTSKKSVPNPIIKGVGGTPQFAVVYTNTLDSNFQSLGGGWEERQIMGNLDKVEIYNHGTTPIYLPHVGIRYSTTPIPLATLTNTGMPPGTFGALTAQGVTPGPHGIQINPGQYVIFKDQHSSGGASSVPAFSPVALAAGILMLIVFGSIELKRRKREA